MSVKLQSRMAVIRQGAEDIRRSNLLSDTFASIVLEDRGACQYVVRKILGMDDLEIVEVKSQYRLLNTAAKDSILDAFAQDANGRLINIEIQKRDTVDHARRTRYYGSMIDKSSLDKGAQYKDLPDVYIIYISETDLWRAGETAYPVVKTLGRSAIPYDDGSHVVFVNAAVDDGSEVARMMRYFKTADPDDMSQGELSRRVSFLKQEQGGYEMMCEAAERIYSQGIEQGIEQGKTSGELKKAQETAIKLSKKGWSEEEIADLLNYTVDTVREWLELQPA